MKITSLNFYDNFKCIAGDCKHSCCTLWEIDIDKKSLVRYGKIKGDFSDRIKEGVDFTKSCFNIKNGKCAFLNDRNLCDLIINCGEKSLCQICRDHPRYRNYFNSHIEMGYGICCEVALNKVLDFKDKVKENIIRKCFTIKRDNKIQREILKTKHNIFNILAENIDFCEKTNKILSEIGIKKEDVFLKDYNVILQSMELLNKDFKNKIDLLGKRLEDIDEKNFEKSLENLLYYFIHRHLSNAIDNLDIKTRIVFSVASVLIIGNISNNLTKKKGGAKENLKEVAREYSVEIEYSDNNYYKFLDKIDEFIK